MPIPSPKGFFSDLDGMVSASVCLPGFYAPTIEVREFTLVLCRIDPTSASKVYGSDFAIQTRKQRRQP